MATIFGVTVTFALPENDTRQQNRSIGRAHDGTIKVNKFRGSDRIIVIPLRGLTETVKESLATALEGAANFQGTIAPDSHVNLGAGAGTSITAQWLDNAFDFTKNKHDSWDGTLTFQRLA